MQELFALIIDYIRSGWRFRWHALGIAWLVCIAGWAFVALQPDRYEARSRVYVDTYSELRRLMPNQIVQSNVEEQLRFVRESMLGRVQLERLARMSDLDIEVRSPTEMSELVAALRRQIEIGTTGTSSRGQDAQPAGSIYTISYQHPDPRKAEQVVANLLNILIEETLGAQQSTSAITGQFLQSQIAEYEVRLRAAEDRIADFNRRYYDRLPGMQGGYFQRLQNEMSTLAGAQERFSLAEARLTSIDLQLTGEASQIAGAEGILTQSVDARIRDTDARLEELLLRYTDKHPDVVAAQQNLELLHARRDDQISGVTSGDLLTSSASPVLQALQIARNEAAAEVATLRTEVRTRESRINELRALIDEVPGVEAELAQLTRDYNVTNTQYQSMLASLERERLTRVAQQSESVEFRVIDPPAAGMDPVYPPRAIHMVLVLLVGLGAGGAFALFMTEAKPVFNSAAHLINATGLQVVGTVGRLSQSIDHRARHVSIALFGLGCASLILTFSGVVAFEVFGGGVRSLL